MPLLVAVTVVVTSAVPPVAVAAVTPGRVAAAVTPEGSPESRDPARGGSGNARLGPVEAAGTQADGTVMPDDLVAELQTLLSHQARSRAGSPAQR